MHVARSRSSSSRSLFLFALAAAAGCGAPSAHFAPDDAGHAPLDDAAPARPDAPAAVEPDAGAAIEPDAGAAPRSDVSLRVWRDGAPHGDAIAVLHDADGRPLEVALTDAAGLARFDVAGRGDGPFMVTIRNHRGHLRTTTDVVAGDELCFGLREVAPHRTVEVALPISPPPAGASTIELTSAGCGTATSPRDAARADLTACADGAPLHVLARALDEGGGVIAYASALDQPHDARAVALASWRTSLDAIDVSMAETLAPELEIGAVRGGAALPLARATGPGTLALPRDLGERFMLYLTDRDRATTRWLDALPPALSLDGDRDLMPEIAIAIAIADPEETPSRPHVAWTVARESDADLTQVRIAASTSWLISTSGERREIVFPELPEILADARPTSGAWSVMVQRLDYTWLDADDVRRSCPGITPPGAGHGDEARIAVASARTSR